MVNSVNGGLGNMPAGGQGAGKGSKADEGQSNFQQLFEKTLSETNQKKLHAHEMQDGLATGEHRKLHETMIASQDASLSFKMVTQVRNKVVDAYKAIWRMPV